jgi:hypothetical protein
MSMSAPPILAAATERHSMSGAVPASQFSLALRIEGLPTGQAHRFSARVSGKVKPLALAMGAGDLSGKGGGCGLVEMHGGSYSGA